MRDLTEDELKLAPDWAVKFDFFDGRLIFMSDAVEVTNQTSTFRFIEIYSGDYWVGSAGDYYLCTRLIVKEPFDITKYGFSDSDLSAELDGVGRAILTTKYYDNHHELYDSVEAAITKADLIAMCKAIGVTAKDLN